MSENVMDRSASGMSPARISGVGIILGSIGLLLALYHLWAGPFSPQPTLEDIVAEKAVSIKEKTMAKLRGESAEAPVEKTAKGVDSKVQLVVALLGGVAVILGVVGVAFKEPVRVAGGSIFLGAFTLAFQFLIYAVAMFIVAMLVAATLGKLDFDF